LPKKCVHIKLQALALFLLRPIWKNRRDAKHDSRLDAMRGTKGARGFHSRKNLSFSAVMPIYPGAKNIPVYTNNSQLWLAQSL
jgi:hypothetical protein